MPGRLQSLGEVWYEFIHNMVKNVLGPEGKPFFPLVFSLFSFVLVANMLGMFPYFFTVTSHVVVTASLAVFVVALVVVVGIAKHGLGWFKLFVPHGVPMVILPFISLIEIISFLSRPVSLGLRLFGNMLAGHIVLKVFAGFVVSLASFGASCGILGADRPAGHGGGPDRARIPGGVPAGLRLRDPHLRLPQRRAPHPSLIFTLQPNLTDTQGD